MLAPESIRFLGLRDFSGLFMVLSAPAAMGKCKRGFIGYSARPTRGDVELASRRSETG